MIDRITEQKIKDAADIVDIVGEFVKLEKKGSDYVGLCPFHDDHTPSFHVSPSRKSFKCFVCDEGGDVVSFVMKKLALSYPEALEWLAAKYNVNIPHEYVSKDEWKLQRGKEAMYATNAIAMEHYEAMLSVNAEAKAYFDSRGVKAEMIEKFHLGFAPNDTTIIETVKEKQQTIKHLFPTDVDITFKSGKTLHVDNGTGIIFQHEGRFYDRFANRIVFPWMDSKGNVVAFGGRKLDTATHGIEQKYVNSPDSAIYHKNHELYGFYQSKSAIAKGNRAYMVEGYLDVILMHQIGIENVVANSGTALSEHQITILKKLTNNITLVYDSDMPGIHAALRSLGMLLEDECNVKILLLPDGEDPASFIQNHSQDEVRQYIHQNTKDFVRFMCDVLFTENMEVDSMSESIEQILTYISKVRNEIKRELYFKEFTCFVNINEVTLRKRLNEICGIETTEPTYYELTEEAAGIRRILYFVKMSIAEHFCTDYMPEEDWKSDKCLHTYDEYMKELQSLKQQLYSFINEGTNQIVVGDLNVRCQTYEEYRALGEHKSVKSINMVNGIPKETEIIEFRYPYTRTQYEERETLHRKEICEWFMLILSNIDEQLNVNESSCNNDIVKLQTQGNARKSQDSGKYEDDLPF